MRSGDRPNVLDRLSKAYWRGRNGVRVLYALDKGPLGPGVEQVFGNTRLSSGIYCLARGRPYPHMPAMRFLPTHIPR